MNRKSFFIVLLLAIALAFAGCKKTNDTAKEDADVKNEATEEKKEESTEEKTDEKAEESKESAETVEDLKDKQVFVKPEWAKALIDGKTNYNNFVVAEVTWGEAKDSPDYLKEHIPGAIHINTDSIEEGPVWNYRKPEEIEKALLDAGVTKDTTVLLYGPDTGVDRVAVCMLYAGVDRVLVLDGGLNAWKSAGYDVEADEVKPTPATEFGTTVPAHPEYILSLEQVKEKMSDPNFKLVSIRSEEEWKGETSGYSYIPKGGEPKGAVWGKSGNGNSGMEFYLNEDGTNKDFAEIENMWKENGFDTSNELSFYCGTGWRAALPWLMMYERGFNPTLFDGGWNEWQMHDELEAQVGDPKDSDSTVKKVGELSDDKALQK